MAARELRGLDRSFVAQEFHRHLAKALRVFARPHVLLARHDQVLSAGNATRRSVQTSDDTIALLGFELNLAQALLRDATETVVRLRPQAMSVLQLLARNAGRVVTKDELMQSVWAGTVVTDDSLVQCVKEIRQALRDHDHRIVRTSLKRGYWLVLPNRSDTRGHDSRDGAITGMTVDAEASTPPTPAVTGAPSRRSFGMGRCRTGEPTWSPTTRASFRGSTGSWSRTGWPEGNQAERMAAGSVTPSSDPVASVRGSTPRHAGAALTTSPITSSAGLAKAPAPTVCGIDAKVHSA